MKIITAEEDVREFIREHAGEIRGLYHDGYFKMGGWNGIMSALEEVEKRYGIGIGEIIPSEDHEEDDFDEYYLDEDIFERIIREEL
jgi:hypothetical protein